MQTYHTNTSKNETAHWAILAAVRRAIQLGDRRRALAFAEWLVHEVNLAIYGGHK